MAAGISVLRTGANIFNLPDFHQEPLKPHFFLQPHYKLNDNELLKYSRQIMLPEIDIAGQEKLLSSSALLIGLGGLGSPVAMYLAAAGIGKLTLVDFDSVDLSNLQRQIIHNHVSIGQLKVDSARQTLLQLNKDCTIETVSELLKDDELGELINSHDITIDATDNFATRDLINRQCVKHRKPLVSGAAIRWDGHVTTFSNQDDSPCYHCLYGSDADSEDESCTENGVLAPVVGIIGSIQATETIKQLTGAGTTLEGRLLILDGIEMTFKTLKINKDPECKVCGNL